MNQKIRSTTVLCVRRDGKVVMAGDGQVTLGSEVLKSTRASCAGFITIGSWPDLPDPPPTPSRCSPASRAKLEQFNGNLPRAVVELAKDWRTDKVLRHLEALLLVADAKNTFILSGNGDVIEPDEDIAAIGSGGPFATLRRHRADATTRSSRQSRSPKRR